MEEEQPKTATVTAPSDLDAGYTFEATVDGKDFTVTVPEGGVKEGQTIQVPYPTSEKEDDAPKGAWKHGLFSCFDVFCDGLFWMSWCCDPLLLGQLMTRTKLNWCAEPDSPQEVASTFAAMTFTFVAFLVACCFGIGLLFLPVFLVFMWMVRTRTRKVYRNKYGIETGKCGDTCEDFCCAVWCSCCTGVQMARHTHDEEKYPYMCCTNTGLPVDAPELEM